MASPPMLPGRIAAKIIIAPSGHWVWVGAMNGRARCDYGRYSRWLAHRLVYTLLVGSIPDGYEIDHLCRYTRCVKPMHLQPVPHRTNVLRGFSDAARHARKTACPKCGGPYETPEQGARFCRPCRAANMRAWGQANRNTGEGTGARQREKTHCPRGHEYTPENTYRRPGKGNRDCKICRRDRKRKH